MNKENKKLIKTYGIALILFFVFMAILFYFPENKDKIIDNSTKYFIEFLLIFPGIVILIGLFSVWVSNETVVKYMGKHTGLKGSLISVFLGSLPTGPLFIAFPIASSLIKKGASISNIIVFLSAWACLKIPQEIVEIQFLGFEFMALRWILTVVLVIGMGFLIEKMIDKKNVIGINN
ncbi:MAG: permease [Candidatus Aenigmarchaeota archaeon]|nr:permease [Candidatus Aenigmarchaeota archaeon]